MFQELRCVEIDAKPSRDELEQYVLGHCREAESRRLEEHLLVCEYCRRELAEADSYVTVIRTALRQCHNDSQLTGPLIHGLTEAWERADAHLVAMHATDQGIMLLFVCPAIRGGNWLARVVGGTIDAGDWCDRRGHAVVASHRLFSEMFPEHVCSVACHAGPTT
jgi:hypothetical protein